VKGMKGLLFSLLGLFGKRWEGKDQSGLWKPILPIFIARVSELQWEDIEVAEKDKQEARAPSQIFQYHSERPRILKCPFLRVLLFSAKESGD